jgi:choline monooxygenase
MDGEAEILRRIAGPEAIECNQRPLAEAKGLGSLAYSSPSWLALENRLLFQRSWIFAGYARDIAASGTVMPVSVAGVPLLLARGQDGTLRAFHNVCRHRGTLLLDKTQTSVQAISCPYHAWTYGLDGRLQLRPHFLGGDRHDQPAPGSNAPGLRPVSVAQWFDWIFVNIDGRAGPFEAFFEPIARRVSGYDLSATRYAGSLTFTVQCNWKIAIENWIEPYHVFAAHPRLHAFVKMRERQPSMVDGHVAWNFYQFRKPEVGRGVGLPYLANLGPELASRGMWFTAFPHFSFEIYPDHIATFLVTPLAPDRTLETIDIYLVGDAATAPGYEAQRRGVFDMWRDLNAEDIGVIEGMQKGRTSPGFEGDCFSPYWDEAVRHLARLTMERMRASGGTA